jgi:hypothetical protein
METGAPLFIFRLNGRPSVSQVSFPLGAIIDGQPGHGAAIERDTTTTGAIIPPRSSSFLLPVVVFRLSLFLFLFSLLCESRGRLHPRSCEGFLLHAVNSKRLSDPFTSEVSRPHLSLHHTDLTSFLNLPASIRLSAHSNTCLSQSVDNGVYTPGDRKHDHLHCSTGPALSVGSTLASHVTHCRR